MTTAMFVKNFLISEAIPERSTFSIAARDLVSPEGVPVEPNQVTSIKATLRDVTSGTIVNGRNAVEVKGDNGGSITTGLFVLQLAEDDTAIIGAASAEQRILTLDFRLFGGGRLTGKVSFWVLNLQDITA